MHYPQSLRFAHSCHPQIDSSVPKSLLEHSAFCFAAILYSRHQLGRRYSFVRRSIQSGKHPKLFLKILKIVTFLGSTLSKVSGKHCRASSCFWTSRNELKLLKKIENLLIVCISNLIVRIFCCSFTISICTC